MNSRLKNFYLNLIALFIGLGAVALLVIAAEGFLWLRAKKAAQASQERVQDNQSEFFQLDAVLGVKCKADYVGSHRVSVDGKEIFSAHYEIDQYSRRVTPVEHEEEREEAALFFGCSFCFGFGVEQDETLPAVFGRECTTMLPVNFANPGHGPQHTWLMMQQPDFLEKVPREKGIFLYGLIDDHISRLMGDKRLVDNWGRWLPWLEVTEEGVVSRGFMEDRESNDSRVLKLLQRTHFGRFIVNRLGLVKEGYYTKEEGFHAVCRVFADMKERLKTILPGYKFMVFSFPGAFHEPAFAALMQEYNIPFFDYDTLYKHLGNDVGDYFFADSPGTRWGHPKARTYADVAALLAEDLTEYCAKDEAGAF